jgi:hypothetical protein
MFKADNVEDIYKISEMFEDPDTRDYLLKQSLTNTEDFELFEVNENLSRSYLKTNDGKYFYLGTVDNPKKTGLMGRSEEQATKRLSEEGIAQDYSLENIDDMFIDVAKFGLDNFAAIAKGGTQQAVGIPGDVREIYNLIQDGIVNLADYIRTDKDDPDKPSPFNSKEFRNVMNDVGKSIFYFMGIDPTNRNLIKEILDNSPTTTQVKEFFDKQNWASLMQKDNPFEGLGELFVDFLVTKKATPKSQVVDSLNDAQQTLKSMQTKPIRGRRNAK